MQTTINKGLVKYSAGRAIFCPHCQDIADAKRWVVATIGDRTLGTCAPCWDKAIAGKALPESIEVLDGRVLFARPRKAKKAKPAEVTL
jgi:hypothetical protein